jgi:hypothetical protein
MGICGEKLGQSYHSLNVDDNDAAQKREGYPEEKHVAQILHIVIIKRVACVAPANIQSPSHKRDICCMCSIS